MKTLLALLALLAGCLACSGADVNWLPLLQERIPQYGHRNWVVIADSAYPAQSRGGIETVVSNAGQADVLRGVLDALRASKHVTPILYTDKELNYLEEKDAPGIGAYRKELGQILGSQKVNVLPHLQIIGKLDQVSQTFRVLIIKTNMTLPYTSVFLQLDCAYWGVEAEKRLRAKMAAAR
ncbi:MAG TPA: RbsD/FucU domain-containing protein [Bryobacteraceae bacterium]|nr:RbsD/FucU domain-containing protein [Bryobacteraceae bacterium]